jgi:hypothetical protein
VLSCFPSFSLITTEIDSTKINRGKIINQDNSGTVDDGEIEVGLGIDVGVGVEFE